MTGWLVALALWALGAAPIIAYADDRAECILGLLWPLVLIWCFTVEAWAVMHHAWYNITGGGR